MQQALAVGLRTGAGRGDDCTAWISSGWEGRFHSWKTGDGRWGGESKGVEEGAGGRGQEEGSLINT